MCKKEKEQDNISHTDVPKMIVFIMIIIIRTNAFWHSYKCAIENVTNFKGTKNPDIP